MSNFDLDPYLNGPLTGAGKSSYNSRKFQPRRGRAPERSRYDSTQLPPGSPASWGQFESGEALTRAPMSEEEVRVRPDGGIPKHLLAEEHFPLLVSHPQYQTITNADGSREFYTVREGFVRCKCGQQHDKYPNPKPTLNAGEIVHPWPEDMLLAAGIDISPRVVDEAVPDDEFWRE